MNWARSPAVVRAPATSANLGPGFDAFGLALGLHDQVEARVTGGGLAVQVLGEGEETAGAGERHLVVRAMRAAFDAMGGQPAGLVLRCTNGIPHGRGLGSSAAAVVSGILAARALVADGTDRLPDTGVLRLAVDLEGHPDNVAACLAGGLTVAWHPAVTDGCTGSGADAVPRAEVTRGERPAGRRRATAPVRRASRDHRRGLCGARRHGDARGAGGAARVGPARGRGGQRGPQRAATGRAHQRPVGALRRHRGLPAPAVPGGGHAGRPPTCSPGCAGPGWRR